MKLIRVFLVVVVVSFVVGVGGAFNGKSNPKMAETELTPISVDVPETKENNSLDDSTNIVSVGKEDEKEITSVISETKKQDSVSGASKKTEKESIMQNNKQNSVVEEQKKEVVEDKSKQEVKEQPKEEIIKQEIEIDTELERFKEQVEYATYDSCMEVGFEKSLEDTVGILGFSCQYIAYKGEILGYKLILNYTNPMDN